MAEAKMESEKLVLVRAAHLRKRVTVMPHGKQRFDEQGEAEIPALDAYRLCVKYPRSGFVLAEEVDQEVGDELDEKGQKTGKKKYQRRTATIAETFGQDVIDAWEAEEQSAKEAKSRVVEGAEYKHPSQMTPEQAMRMEEAGDLDPDALPARRRASSEDLKKAKEGREKAFDRNIRKVSLDKSGKTGEGDPSKVVVK